MARAFDDASNQYLNNTSAVVTDTPLTMSCWFNVDDTAVNHVLMGCGDTDNNSIFWLYARDTPDVDIGAVTRSELAATWVATSTSTWGTGAWHHAAGVWGSGNSDRNAFIDGGNKGSDTNVANISGIDNTTIAARHYNSTVSLYASGYIAEAAIWNVDLTDAEIAILGLGYSPLFVRPAFLAAYWPLIGRNSPEIDRVGGYNMTLNASPTTAAHPRVIYPARQSIVTPQEFSPIGQQFILPPYRPIIS